MIRLTTIDGNIALFDPEKFSLITVGPIKDKVSGTTLVCKRGTHGLSFDVQEGPLAVADLIEGKRTVQQQPLRGAAKRSAELRASRELSPIPAVEPAAEVQERPEK